MPELSRRRRSTSTKIHVMAVDGIVTVNSLFTFALFLGLSWYPTSGAATTLLAPADPCAAAADVAERLIACHVYSFSSFLFSSLVASAMKQAIRIGRSGEEAGHGCGFGLRVGMVVSAVGSGSGCGFLMMAMVEMVQIKLGRLGCSGRWETPAAVIPLVSLVPVALVVYIVLVLHAVIR